MEQLTKQQAIEIAESRIWETWTDNEIVKFQLFQRCLAMDFSRFKKALSNVLGRDIFSHEFMNQSDLQKEYLGEKPAPNFQEIVELIPKNKLILVGNIEKGKSEKL